MNPPQTIRHSDAALSPEPQLHFTPPKSHRFLFLDALRGIAALFIVAYHIPNAMTSSFALNGQLAVDFFFCLSGFVIAFSYERRLTETLSFKDFAVARVIRLYPIYLLGSFLGFLSLVLVAHFAFHSAHLWSDSSQLLILALFLWPTRLSHSTQPFNYPLNIAAWSLFFEFFASFLYAVLVKIRASRTPVLVFIATGSLTTFTYIVVSGNHLDVGGTQTGFGLGFARVTFSFVVGVLIFRLYHSQSRNSNPSWINRLGPLLITLLLIGILSSPFSWMRTEIFRLIAISLCFPTMVYYGAVARLPHSFTRLTTALGELSYPLYLLHIPFVSLMRARRLARFTAAHTSFAHILVLLILAIFAFFSWQIGEHVDLPIRRALTRRYNSYKLTKIAPIPSQASTTE